MLIELSALVILAAAAIMLRHIPAPAFADCTGSNC
jgi:hypothetical protein